MTSPSESNLDRPPGDDETTVGERVYAPASERVPKEPVPGHRDMVEHPDTDTPERQAAADDPSMPAGASSEPPFARVARPSTTAQPTVTPTPTPYTSAVSNPAFDSPWPEQREKSIWQRAASFGWLVLPACAAVGVFVYVRRRREQNKPINRLRRQAQQTASELRGRVPDAAELIQPAMGVLAAMLSTGVMVGRQVQRQRALKRASQAVSDADWQKRLNALKERWNPGRVELEKISISRHH
jgi:hypothetical protein